MKGRRRECCLYERKEYNVGWFMLKVEAVRGGWCLGILGIWKCIECG